MFYVSIGSHGYERARTYELNGLGHLHLGEKTSSNIIAKSAGATNLECVGPFHGNLHGFAAVQLCHSLDLAKSHVVSIFKTVSCLV